MNLIQYIYNQPSNIVSGVSKRIKTSLIEKG